MSIEKLWRTSDSKIFLNENDAQKHEEEVIILENKKHLKLWDVNGQPIEDLDLAYYGLICDEEGADSFLTQTYYENHEYPAYFPMPFYWNQDEECWKTIEELKNIILDIQETIQDILCRTEGGS